MQMAGSRENRFDSQIRAILGDAREEVPEGLWQGIERRLGDTSLTAGRTGAADPAAGRGKNDKTRTVPLWLKISSGIAAAAVLAAGLFLSGIMDSPDTYHHLATADDSRTFGIIESGRQEILMADIPHARSLSADSRRTAALMNGTGSETAEKNISDTGTEAGADIFHSSGTDALNTDGTASDRNAVTADTGNNAGHVETVSPEDLEEDNAGWERLLQEESAASQGMKASITLSGNAISNTNSATSSDRSALISYRPGRNELKEDLISESGESSYAIPLSFGVGVKIDFTERWSLGVGFNYSHLKRTFAGNFFDVHEDGTITETSYSNIMNRLDYIGIPLNVFFNIMGNRFINFYAYAGGTAEKCISNRYIMPAGDRNIYHHEAVRGFQFSADLGLGMEFIIADTFGIFIDPSLRYYFPNESQPQSIRTAQPLMFGLEMGLRIHL